MENQHTMTLASTVVADYTVFPASPVMSGLLVPAITRSTFSPPSHYYGVTDNGCETRYSLILDRPIGWAIVIHNAEAHIPLSIASSGESKTRAKIFDFYTNLSGKTKMPP